MTKPEDAAMPAVDFSPVERGAWRPVPKRSRSCEHGCTDYDDEDLLECPRCHGDGMDPWNDHLFACPLCGGMGAP